MPKTVKITFPANEGHTLSGYIQLPANQHPSHFALFAHCFSCTKNIKALRHIARALNQAGFGVLRFDMTGLGESEGDFAEGGFTSNISDILAAYGFLKSEYQAPALLIGHSLGGTAALCAAAHMPDVKAVVTIGSPSNAEHVKHHFSESIEEIQKRGRAQVHLQGRPFEISLDFLDSLKNSQVENSLKASRKALLVLHSPQDTTVDISHAERIYVAAHHPKSFASLDGADHMLTNKADAYYAGQLISGWVSRYLPAKAEPVAIDGHESVAVRLGNEGFTTEVMVRHHSLIADEPESVGGNDFGPGPYELVSAGLGACTAMTLHMYARRKKWPLDKVEVRLRHFKDYPSDMQAASEEASAKTPNKIDHFEREISIEGDELTDEQIARLLEMADRCPVHRTLEAGAKVVTKLIH